MTDLNIIFDFEMEQEVIDEGIYRRYVLDPNLVLSKSGLIREMYDLFKNNLSFDGFPIYRAVLSFKDIPRRPISPIDINFDNNMNEKFVTCLINSIDSMNLEIGLGVIWTYTDKQQCRNNLNSWRNEVLKDGICVCCGGTKHLEAHHIFGFAKYEHLRDDPNNGVALCKWCHKKYHSYFPEDANPANLIKFIKRFGVSKDDR